MEELSCSTDSDLGGRAPCLGRGGTVRSAARGGPSQRENREGQRWAAEFSRGRSVHSPGF